MSKTGFVTKLSSPPPRKSRLAAPPPPPQEAPDHLSTPSDESALQDLNFKVAPKFHRRFKTEAVLRGMSMKELLEASFQAYLREHGGTTERPREDLIES